MVKFVKAKVRLNEVQSAPGHDKRYHLCSDLVGNQTAFLHSKAMT